MTEEGQEEDGEHIVERHYHAVFRVSHAEYALQDERHYVIVNFPEAHNAHKGKAHKQGALEVEFHLIFACDQSFLFTEHIFLPLRS